MRVGLALSFLLTSVTFACDICKAPQRSAGDDAGESVLELSLDSLESVVAVHSLVVLLLYDDRTAARQRLQSFARAAAALKELETLNKWVQQLPRSERDGAMADLLDSLG